MTAPIPKVRRVPRCSRCHGTTDLIEGDGLVVCRDCIRVCVQLAGTKR